MTKRNSPTKHLRRLYFVIGSLGREYRKPFIQNHIKIRESI